MKSSTSYQTQKILFTTLTLLFLTGLTAATTLSSSTASSTLVQPGTSDVKIMEYTVQDGGDVVAPQGVTNDVSPGDQLTTFDDQDDVYTTSSDATYSTVNDNLWKETDAAQAKVYNENGQLVSGTAADTSLDSLDPQFDIRFDGGSFNTITLENIDDSSPGIEAETASTLGIEGTENSPSAGQVVKINSQNYIVESVGGSTQSDTVSVIGDSAVGASTLTGLSEVNVQDSNSLSQINSATALYRKTYSTGPSNVVIDSGTYGHATVTYETSNTVSNPAPKGGLVVATSDSAVDNLGYGGDEEVPMIARNAQTDSEVDVLGYDEPGTEVGINDNLFSASESDITGSGTDTGADIAPGNTDGESDGLVVVDYDSTPSNMNAPGIVVAIDSDTNAANGVKALGVTYGGLQSNTQGIYMADDASFSQGDNLIKLQPGDISFSDTNEDATATSFSFSPADTNGVSAGDVVAFDEDCSAPSNPVYAVADDPGSGSAQGINILSGTSGAISDDEELCSVSTGTTGSQPTIDLDDTDLETGSDIASEISDKTSGSAVYGSTGYSSSYKIDSTTTGSGSSVSVDDSSGSGTNVADKLEIDSESDQNFLSKAPADIAIANAGTPPTLSDDSTQADHQVTGSNGDDLKFWDQDTDSSNSNQGNDAWNVGEDVVQDADDNGVYQDEVTEIDLSNDASSDSITDSQVNDYDVYTDTNNDGFNGDPEVSGSTSNTLGTIDIEDQAITQDTTFYVTMDVKSGLSQNYDMKASNSLTTAGTESLSVTNANTQTVDSSAPDVAINSIPSTVESGDSVTVDYDLTDEEGVDNAESDLVIDNGPSGQVARLAPLQSGTRVTKSPTLSSNIEEGDYDVTLTGKDAAGNTNTSTETLTVDNLVSSLTVTDGPVSNDDKITVEGQASSTADKVAFQFDDGSQTATKTKSISNQDFSVEIDLSSLSVSFSEGTVDLRAEQADTFNSAEDSITFTVDNTKPSISYTGPTGPIANDSPESIRFEVSDSTSGIDQSTISVGLGDSNTGDGNELDGVGKGSDYVSYSSGTVEINLSESSPIDLAEGDVDVSLSVGDGAGNTNSSSKTDVFTVDTVDPSISSANTNDLNKDGKIDQINVTLNEAIDDSDSILNASTFSLDTGTVDSVETGTADDDKLELSVSGISDTSATPDVTLETGLNYVALEDKAGNTKTSDGSAFTSIDKANPVLMYAEIDHSASTSSGTSVKLEFSEGVEDSSTGNSKGVSIHGNTFQFSNPDTLETTKTVDYGDVLDTADSPMVSTSEVVDGNSNSAVNLSGQNVEVDTFRKDIVSGWNYVSFPIGDRGSVSISNVLDTSKVDSVWRYIDGQWKSYDPDASNNPFNTFEGGVGYQIKASSSFTLDPNVNNTDTGGSGGNVPTDSVELETGWNLIGQWQEYNQEASSSAGKALDGISSTYLDQVVGQDSSGSSAADFSSPFRASDGTTSGKMQTGDAYWMWSQASTPIQYRIN